MTHRELRVALAGMVAGILIGSAAIASVNQSAPANAFLVPDINSRFHNAPDPGYTTKRSVNRRGIPFRDEPRNDPFSTVKPETGGPRPVTVCEAVQASVARMRAGHKTHIPDNVANTELLSNLERVLAGIEADYPCPKTEAAVSSAASSASSAGVNNHCENYPHYTARYTQCVISERSGKKFP